jgi:hypothetical protein
MVLRLLDRDRTGPAWIPVVVVVGWPTVMAFVLATAPCDREAR